MPPTGPDLSKWSVKVVWLNGVTFHSLKELRQAWTRDTDGLRTNWDYKIPGEAHGNSSSAVV